MPTVYSMKRFCLVVVPLLLVGPQVVGAGPLLVDRAREWGLDFLHFNGMSGELYFSEMMGSGLAWLDYDGDGDLDIYLVQGTMLGVDKTLADATLPAPEGVPLTDRLYRNDMVRGEGGARRPQFVDTTEASGIVAAGYGMGVAIGDYDRDGWPDIYVTNFGANELWHNNGDGTFSDVTSHTGTADRSWTVSAAFLDYDADGWPDLFVGNYVAYSLATHKTCSSSRGAIDYCSPLAYALQADRLFHNRGDGTFADVSLSSGVALQRGSALGAVVSDFDGNGCVDLYVANDQMNNYLWSNRCDGTFEDMAMLAGTAVNQLGQPEASMGVLAEDMNGDGAVDLFVTHLTRETNTLYLNDGKGNFLDATSESGLGLPSFASTGFGVALFDGDGDGHRDLYIATGAVKRIEAQMRAGATYPLAQPDQLFMGLGGGLFEVAPESAEFDQSLTVGRGVAVADVDTDGDEDLAVSANAGPPRLWVNGSSGSQGWLGLRWVDPLTGILALGGRASVAVGETESGATSRVDGSYGSARDPSILFGLGSETGPVSLLLEQGGRRMRLSRFPAGHYAVLPLERRMSR